MSTTPSSEFFIPKLKTDIIISMLGKGLRPNGRKVDEIRPVTIIKDYIPNADGSALVKLGNTQVLVGVKLEIGTPFSDTPNEGNLMVNAEFMPTASPVFEPGPPDENAIELSRVIDRGIRESKAIDLSKLAIISGRKVWNIWVDIYVLDHDGNLIDASSIGTLAALMSTKLPNIEVKDSGEIVIDKSNKGEPLPLSKAVAAVTIGKIGNYLIVDPDIEEESLLDSRLTVIVDEDGSIAGLQKSGAGYLIEEELPTIINIALSKGKEVINTVRNIVKGSK
ncbi:MAG: exosome complex protein Rrp42 [Sulfolobales archaeon]|nr:exosome complex protein Rrp42 [Sulfolobales archaeon]MCX8185840.1 exosome complex protein Rrp42 [Sulfolobales archaeon]MDW7969097.1 exosome complex protein Rrp42 [Sulfolobales archaeon]